MTAPLATYRLQLHSGFGFAAAAAVIPYLARLGVSHLYTSPILQAEAGSTHGYDVVDHASLNRELGGEAGFDKLVGALRSHGMGLVVDIVPNHMAISPANRWWWDVLEHGPASRYAGYFDVDWDPPEARLRNVILLPVLGDHYGRELEAGAFSLERRRGNVVVAYGAQHYPLDPRSLAPILAAAAVHVDSDELAFIARALAGLPPATSTAPAEVERRQEDGAVLAERLTSLATDRGIGAALDAELAAVTADHDRMDALLEEQNYRLAFWRAATHDLGYRRFFDIDTLVGLRVERREVFDATHRLILERVAAGEIQGLRIDHPDGLRDPAGYFARLRDAAPGAWIVAEKILESGEALRDWPIQGTTGYRFANLATRLLVDPAGEDPMTRTYRERTGAETDWHEVVHRARLAVLSESLGSDLNRLTDLWLSICEANRRYRDFTRHELHEALREVAGAFEVYRTYVRASDGTVSAEDRHVVRGATARAAAGRPDLDADLFEFLGAILLLEVPGRLPAELAMRFQQLTPAGMAKGAEDTAFYRYLRLVALNEVGGDPGSFGGDREGFHRQLEADRRRHPHAMLTTSTHDTKRSEDVRARLALLSEQPDAWRRSVERLALRAAPHRSDPQLPGPKAEYLFYQTLVGAWPIDAGRCRTYMEKAAREAKEDTSWTAPDETFDRALSAFVEGCLGDSAFVSEAEAVVAPLVEPGRVNALAQLLWKLTAPGVPDLYQGSELWDLSLVDPDNRRPVDFALRARLLDDLEGLPPAWEGLDEGLPKLWLSRQALALRARRREDLDGAAAYRPLAAVGPAAGHVVAYRRGKGVVAVAPRLPLRLAADGGWRATCVEVGRGRWGNVLSGATLDGPRIDVEALLEPFPVALLERLA